MSKARRKSQVALAGADGAPGRGCSPATATALALLMAMATPLMAQDAPTDAQEPVDPSRETDISEENYRRYMELRDPRLERPAFPTTQFKPTAGLQKMGQLPESSQKHLRNQLRGMILQSGPWSPEELQRPYRFTPSEAARKDATLLRAEMEAWAELVGEYHQREAANLAAREGVSVGEILGQGQSGAANGAAADAQAGRAGMTAAQATDAMTSPTAAPGQNPPARRSQDPAQAPGSNNSPGQETGQGGLGQGQADGQGKGAGSGSAGDAARQAQAQTQEERPRDRRRPAVDDWQDMDGPAARGTSTEGVEQSAADFLRAQGLLDNNPDAMPIAAPAGSAVVPAPTQPPDRWGAMNGNAPPRQARPTPATPTPPAIGTAAPSPSRPTGPDSPPAPGATMPLDALEQVRGLGEADDPPEGGEEDREDNPPVGDQASDKDSETR